MSALVNLDRAILHAETWMSSVMTITSDPLCSLRLSLPSHPKHFRIKKEKGKACHFESCEQVFGEVECGPLDADTSARLKAPQRYGPRTVRPGEVGEHRLQGVRMKNPSPLIACGRWLRSRRLMIGQG
jgi:hypothetical protein